MEPFPATVNHSLECNGKTITNILNKRHSVILSLSQITLITTTDLYKCYTTLLRKISEAVLTVLVDLTAGKQSDETLGFI